MQLLYQPGEIYWMTGVIALGIAYLVFALVWGSNDSSK